MKRMLFIFNPLSGKAKLQSRIVKILNIFTQKGYEVTTRPTQARLDGYNIVKAEGNQFDLIVCSGGDGTLNEIVSGLSTLENRPPLGYIPAGSTNDFGYSLGISSDIVTAAEQIVNGNIFRCDLGKFGERNFTYVAAFGLFTDVTYQTSQALKNKIGHAAYILEGSKRIFHIPTYKIKVEYDNGLIEDEFMNGLITNTISVGGYRKFKDKNISLNDGLFEVTLIKKPSNSYILHKTLTALLNNKKSCDNIVTFETSKLKITSDTEIAWTLDGEDGGSTAEASISCIKQAYDIIIP